MLFNKNETGDDEIAKLASWTAGHEFKHIEESIILAEEWLRMVLGAEVVAAFDGFYNSENFDLPASEEHAVKKDVTGMVQRCLLNYAYKIYAPKGQVHFDNTGVSVKWDEEYRPAQNELPSFIKSLENTAFSFLNMLIRKMNRSPDYFPEWADGTAKKKREGLLIRSAFDFSRLYNIKDSEGYFFYIIDKIHRAQREQLRPAVGTYWDDLWVYHDNQGILAENTYSVDSVESLPPSGFALPYLVKDLGEFWRWNGAEWERLCADLREVHPAALQLVAEHTIYLKLHTDVAELSENPIGSISRLEAHLKSVEAMARHQKTVSESLAALIVKACAELDEQRGYSIVNTDEVEGGAYLPSSDGNSLFF